MHTSTYCGGARPDKQVLQTLKKSRPYANRQIVIKSEQVDRVLRLKTDNKGAISFEAPAGTYQLFLAEKIDYSGEPFNRLACEKWKSTPDVVFSTNQQSDTLNLHKICNPCLPPAP